MVKTFLAVVVDFEKSVAGIEVDGVLHLVGELHLGLEEVPKLVEVQKVEVQKVAEYFADVVVVGSSPLTSSTSLLPLQPVCNGGSPGAISSSLPASFPFGDGDGPCFFFFFFHKVW